MTIFGRAGLLALLLASPAWAWTDIYSADPVAGATSYKWEKSVDLGVTYTGTETGLTIFRVTACNGLTCTSKLAKGVWHNEAWQPLGVPVNVSAQ